MKTQVRGVLTTRVDGVADQLWRQSLTRRTTRGRPWTGLLKFENHAEVVRRGDEGAKPAIEKWLAEIGAA